MNKQLKFEEFIAPVMKKMVAINLEDKPIWNNQQKIYPSGSEENLQCLLLMDMTMADAMKSFDTEYGKDYYAGGIHILKSTWRKDNGKFTPNGFAYRPIYKRILKTN